MTWQRSPLPVEICPCGIDAEDKPRDEFDRDLLNWQQLLLEAAGWPSDCRVAYAANLKKAEDRRDYCVELLRHPERGGIGTNCYLTLAAAEA